MTTTEAQCQCWPFSSFTLFFELYSKPWLYVGSRSLNIALSNPAFDFKTFLYTPTKLLFDPSFFKLVSSIALLSFFFFSIHTLGASSLL
jgi:hypothetical protein